MRIAFVVLVLLHGLIHLLGFVKGFGIREVKELTLPISRPMGLLWLAATVLFLLYAVLYWVNHDHAWLIGLLAVILSQVLVILFWKDAKIGTLPNLIILVVVLVSLGSHQFRRMVERETLDLLAQVDTRPDRLVSEADFNGLPLPVQNWLRQCGIVGKPFIQYGRVEQRARMKMKPDQTNWMQATATQYSIIEEPAFIWGTRVEMNKLLYFEGRDKLESGKGTMLIKMNSLVPIVNEAGDKIDEGSTQRFLGEMVWFPTLALSEHIQWEPIDSSSARATFSYGGTTGSGIFHFNSAGDFVRFSAMRFMGNTPDAQKHEWILSVDGYQTFEGIRVPSEMTATWKLPEGDWTWLELEITDITYSAG